MTITGGMIALRQIDNKKIHPGNGTACNYNARDRFLFRTRKKTALSRGKQSIPSRPNTEWFSGGLELSDRC